MIRVGNFFFRFRNLAFPLIVVALCASAPPPPDSLSRPWANNIKDAGAILLALAGLILRATVIGYAYIRRGGRNKRVDADGLVTEGMFALCRNPLYVGNILIYAGVLLLHGAPPVILAGLVVFGFIYQCIVLAEEDFLLRKFGDEYRIYCAEVPCWMPRLGKFRTATAGMTFNFRRVILKDYSTLCSTLTGLALVEIYKYLLTPEPEDHTTRLYLLAAFVGMTWLVTAIISLCKKHQILRETSARRGGDPVIRSLRGDAASSHGQFPLLPARGQAPRPPESGEQG